MKKANVFLTENKDFIFLTNVEIPCHVGCTKEERAFPQILSMNIKGHLSLVKAGQNDNLRDTLNYELLLQKIRTRLLKEKFSLLETVAEHTATLILNNKQVQKVNIEVSKKIFVGVSGAGVNIERRR